MPLSRCPGLDVPWTEAARNALGPASSTWQVLSGMTSSVVASARSRELQSHGAGQTPTGSSPKERPLRGAHGVLLVLLSAALPQHAFPEHLLCHPGHQDRRDESPLALPSWDPPRAGTSRSPKCFYSVLIPSPRSLLAEQSSYYSSPRFTDDVKFRGRPHAGQQRRAEM